MQWTLKGDLWCSLDGATKSYCTPESYKGTSSRLFHNLGGGKFEDVAQKAGVGDPTSKSLGITVLDYNSDGWPDIFVANDTQPNKLYRNNRNGTFTEEAMAAGVAYGEDGVARGAMGVDAGDYDRSGRAASAGGQLLQPDARAVSQRGQRTLRGRSARARRWAAPACCRLPSACSSSTTTWTATRISLPRTGISKRRSDACSRKCSIKQAPLLFRNHGKGRFEDVSRRMPPEFTRAIVARGAAYADFDHDGDLDVLISTNHGPAYLFRNDGGNRNHWIHLNLVGTRSNREGSGRVVRIDSTGGKQ